MTSKLFVAFVFNLLIRAECYSQYILRLKTLQTKQKSYINRTGGNTNRCNFQTPFSLWLCFLLFKRLIISLQKDALFSFRFRPFPRGLFQLKISQVFADMQIFFRNWNHQAERPEIFEQNQGHTKKGQQSSLKLWPNPLRYSQNMLQKREREIRNPPAKKKTLEKIHARKQTTKLIEMCACKFLHELFRQASNRILQFQNFSLPCIDSFYSNSHLCTLTRL